MAQTQNNYEGAILNQKSIFKLCKKLSWKTGFFAINDILHTKFIFLVSSKKRHNDNKYFLLQNIQSQFPTVDP